MSTTFFDVTDIISYLRQNATVSGIQRVSTMIIREAVQSLGRESVRLAFYDQRRAEYVVCPPDVTNHFVELDLQKLGQLFNVMPTGREGSAAPSLERYTPGSFKFRFHAFKRDLNALIGNERHFQKRRLTAEDWKNWRNRNAKPALRAALVVQSFEEIARPGDQICILGALWNMPYLDAFFLKAAKSGIAIHLMVHDMIPLLLPEHVDGSVPLEFYDWITKSTGYCTSYLANSANTARDLAAFLKEIGCEIPIHTTPLAQTRLPSNEGVHNAYAQRHRALVANVPEQHRAFANKAGRIAALRPEVRVNTLLPYVLCVGTMEPRKNGWRLAQAWQRLVDTPGLNVPRLVFAGKRGWLNDDILHMLDATGGMAGWLQFAEMPTDQELEYLYRNCLFTVMPSLYEGWGLPIGEGLSYGKTGVVSETSSMPEVGLDFVEYCDPRSIESIAAACERLIADPSHREALENRIAHSDLRSWEDVCRDVVDVLRPSGS